MTASLSPPTMSYSTGPMPVTRRRRATTIGNYNYVKAEKIDDYTVKVSSSTPLPFWADSFVGAYGQIIPKHLFQDVFSGCEIARGADEPAAGGHRAVFVQGVPSG